MTASQALPIAPEDLAAARQGLRDLLCRGDRWSIAVSGGVDSVTLATLAHRDHGGVPPVMVHATSPAVPFQALPRLRDHARQEGWDFRIVTAGELQDANYRANPYNRCYFCKSSLYTTMFRELSAQQRDGVIMASGANTDDLGEHRPGLVAAAEFGVRHPFVEAGIGKEMIRALARSLGLTGFSELPAQPCLASRVETGLRIQPADLQSIDRLETRLREMAGPSVTLRVRLRRSGMCLELDSAVLDDPVLTARLDTEARRSVAAGGYDYGGISPYRRGSAFVKELEQ
ncbi:adenine nucleotide alpha hydrolase [Pseudooceanicola sp. C21-150M6]|uniref:adenine nucleotide alpha hydrolase n=1 Tax=Pseudooceanicola sp. C21-150M6 TaxID=3434355 RepID=UPI003D7F5273